jgi:two-component system, chemotaxis family, protein-glutamate methylesterase/glutaminase
LPNHDIVVIGASAGGVEALRTIAAGLPADLPAAVFVVLHMSPEGPGLLPLLLDRAGPLRAVQASDGGLIERGCIYVARPDHHLLLQDNRMRLARGPKENRSRPAVDPLFRSAALEYGPRVIGVVLTGSLDDGAAGLAAIKNRGGVAIVQAPEDALYASMPRSALRAVRADHVLPVSEIAATLARAASLPAEATPPANEPLRVEVAMGAGKPQDIDTLGPQSPYGCPECGGVLNEVEDAAVLRFRCRVGHAYTSETLAAEQEETIEASLWAAMRALEESAELKKKMADRLRPGKAVDLVKRLDAGTRDALAHAASLRRLLGSLEKQLEG